MTCRRLLAPEAESGNAPEKFEDMLARLEQVVAEMENGEMPLDKLLASYEEGMRLAKNCGDRLTEAEQKVEILSRSVEAAPAANESLPIEAKDPATKDDIRLF